MTCRALLPSHLLLLALLAWVVSDSMVAGQKIEELGPLAELRRDHTATLLRDGRVLLAGGANETGPLSSAEVFDPASKTLQVVGEMSLPRAGHSATLLDNGKVIIAGGSSTLGTIDVFDPATGTFQILSILNALRVRHTATLLVNGNVLLAGGDAAGMAELLDPVTGSCVLLSNPLLEPRFGHSALLLDNRRVLLTAGGTETSEIFDSHNLRFTLAPQLLKVERSGHVAILSDSNSLLLIGGDDAGTVEIYNHQSGNGNGIIATLGLDAIGGLGLANRKFLLISPDVAGLFSMDVSPATFSALPDSELLHRAGATLTELPADKSVLVAGGADNQNALLAPVVQFFPASVETDKGDYHPGETVVITASGFLPGEQVEFRVLHIDDKPDLGKERHKRMEKADDDGAVSTTWHVCETNCDGSYFELRALGKKSGLLATTTFTDALAFTAAITPTSDTTSTSTSYTITITNTSDDTGQLGSGKIQIPSGYTGIPSGGTTLSYTASNSKSWHVRIGSTETDKILFSANSCSPNCSNKLNPNESIAITLTVTSPASSGNYEWTSTAFSAANFLTSSQFPTPPSQPVVTVSPPQSSGEVDLEISQSASQSSITAGLNLTYTHTIVNNGPDQALTVNVTDTLPAHTTLVSTSQSQGTVSINGSTITFALGTLAASASASATITVQVEATAGATVVNTGSVAAASPDDPTPGNNSASVTTQVNHRPLANNDSYVAVANTTLLIAAPGVLLNDTDSDNDPITVGIPRPFAGPGNGTLVLNADGSFSYTPTSGYSGSDSFTYKAKDNSNALSSTAATVSMSVGAFTDTDADGLHDPWETLYFGNLAEGPYGDWDGDGTTNLVEFISGNNPVADLGLQVFSALE